MHISWHRSLGGPFTLHNHISYATARPASQGVAIMQHHTLTKGRVPS